MAILIFQLISDAIRYGPQNQEMMDMASYWMLEKQLVHKLFKVLVPRFQNYQGPVTSMLHAPNKYPAPTERRAMFMKTVLELKNNPYPPLPQSTAHRNKNLIHNVLLDAARRDFYDEKKNKEVPSEVD